MAFEDYRAAWRDLSPDEVLSLICDDLRYGDRLTWELHNLTRESSVKDLHRLYETADYWQLGRALNQQFGINASKGEWMSAIYPARSHTLGQLCDFIARCGARTLVMQPLELAGNVSASAGAFLAIRQVLGRAGADVSDLRPSTPLAPYLGSHLAAFREISHLAPGRLPRPNVIAPAHEGLGCAGVACWKAGFLCVLFHYSLRGVELILTGILCWISLAVIARTIRRPIRVQLSWMSDFRDLSRVLAGEREGLWPGFEVVTT